MSQQERNSAVCISRLNTNGQFSFKNYMRPYIEDLEIRSISLWNNSLISISILRDYWLETMQDGHKHLLIYLDFPPEAWGWFLFTVCFNGAKVNICILLE